MWPLCMVSYVNFGGITFYAIYRKCIRFPMVQFSKGHYTTCVIGVAVILQYMGTRMKERKKHLNSVCRMVSFRFIISLNKISNKSFKIYRYLRMCASAGILYNILYVYTTFLHTNPILYMVVVNRQEKKKEKIVKKRVMYQLTTYVAM